MASPQPHFFYNERGAGFRPGGPGPCCALRVPTGCLSGLGGPKGLQSIDEGLDLLRATLILSEGYGAFEGIELFLLRQRARLGRQIVRSPVHLTGNPIGRIEAVLLEFPVADRTERDNLVADVQNGSAATSPGAHGRKAGIVALGAGGVQQGLRPGGHILRVMALGRGVEDAV